MVEETYGEESPAEETSGSPTRQDELPLSGSLATASRARSPLCLSPSAQQQALPVDWSQPRPLDDAERRALGRAHRRLAIRLSEELGELVRGPTILEAGPLVEVPYFEFISSLPNPTSLHHVCVLPQRASFVVELSPGLLFPLLERMLGGRGDTCWLPSRPLTRVEQRLARTVVESLVRGLGALWQPSLAPADDGREPPPRLEPGSGDPWRARGQEESALSPRASGALRFDLAESEHNPLLMQIFGPSEPSLVLTLTGAGLPAPLERPSALESPLKGLDLSGERGGPLALPPPYNVASRGPLGAIRICWPARLFTPLLREVARAHASGQDGAAALRICQVDGRKALQEELSDVELAMDAGPPERTYELADLLALRPGDLLDAGVEESSKILLRVEGHPVLEGRLTEAGGGRFVRITGARKDGEDAPEAPPAPGGAAEEPESPAGNA